MRPQPKMYSNKTNANLRPDTFPDRKKEKRRLKILAISLISIATFIILLIVLKIASDEVRKGVLVFLAGLAIFLTSLFVSLKVGDITDKRKKEKEMFY